MLDDIADSFDYKNKYAIIEFLNDMRDDENFKLVILTHNYDFYRTVRFRLRIFGENKLLSNRENGALQLIEDELSENPFSDWKKKLSDPVILIASIPFVRNLAEYVGNEEVFLRLTSLLHIKDETQTLTIADLHGMYQQVLTAGSFEEFAALTGTVYELIDGACTDICDMDDDSLSLEQKIALSIGIRLAAENCLIEKINDPAYVSGISKSQTNRLIKRYQGQAGCEQSVLNVMKRVSLMTPENIHLNSLMFEPILDMSGNHLKSLYADVKACTE